MKKWIWLVLLVLVVVMAGGWFEEQRDREATPQEYRSPVEAIPVEKGDKGIRFGDDAPQVSADKLFRHIQRLSFTRNTPAERSRTRKYITSELKRFGWQPKLEKFTDGVNILAAVRSLIFEGREELIPDCVRFQGDCGSDGGDTV